MSYRQLEGFTRALHKLVPQLPPGDYSDLRKYSLALNPDPYRHLKEIDEPITIAVDFTGIKVHRTVGWVERKHGKKKRYVKLHFAVYARTKEVVSLEIPTNDVHNIKDRIDVEGPEWKRVVYKRLRTLVEGFNGQVKSRAAYSWLTWQGLGNASIHVCLVLMVVYAVFGVVRRRFREVFGFMSLWGGS